MICFDVEVNGEPYCRAGLDPTGVVSVILNWVELMPEVLSSPRGQPGPHTSLTVSGYRVNGPIPEDPDEPADLTHVHWGEIARRLEPGDEVRIRIVAADAADDPMETPQLAPIDENAEVDAEAEEEAA
ncbi:MAG: hypothetical protein V3S56_06590 [Gemmatimonadota bacterium]